MRRGVVLCGVLLAVMLPAASFAQTGEGCVDIGVAAQVSQGAFTGTIVDVRFEAGNTRTVVSLEVTRVFTGPLPTEGVVEVWFEDGRHGWPGLEGEIGVLVGREEGRWISDSCLVVEAALLKEIDPAKVAPESLGENERETLGEPPLWIFFGIFGGGIGVALWVQRARRGD